jgi:hypothetical protein
MDTRLYNRLALTECQDGVHSVTSCCVYCILLSGAVEVYVA